MHTALGRTPMDQTSNRERRHKNNSSRRAGFNRSTQRARTDAENHRKYNDTCVQYERHMTLIREIANHTFLRAVYKTSMKQAQMEYMQMQRDFFNTQAAAQQPQLFTAQEIINYIELHCICSNEKSIQTIQMSINKTVRHNGQPLLQWL